MKRSGAIKFPQSVQLFKFCQKVLIERKGSKVHDQEVGAILNFNPSDCSHWKRGEKNVKSVFALAKLAETLQIEPSLIHDVASSEVGLDEAYYEFSISKDYQKSHAVANTTENQGIKQRRDNVVSFVRKLHEQSEFKTPPLYLPEIMRFFSFISTQPVDMIDKLSRILKIKNGKYVIHYRKGDLKPQTRMSMVRDLARIIFEGERQRFPELGTFDKSTNVLEQMTFTAEILVPKPMLKEEMLRLDSRKNVVSDLSALFWVPKSLICFQMQDLIKYGSQTMTPQTPMMNTELGQTIQ